MVGRVAATVNPSDCDARHRKSFFHCRSVANESTTLVHRTARMRGSARHHVGQSARAGTDWSRCSSPIVDGSVGASLIALDALAGDPRAHVRIVGLHRLGERKIRQRVLVAAVNARRRRQRGELRQATSTSGLACPRRSGRSPRRTTCRRRTAAGRRPSGNRRYARPCGPECRAARKRRPMPGTSMRSPSASACVRRGIVSRAGPNTGTSYLRRAPPRRRRDRHDDAWR